MAENKTVDLVSADGKRAWTSNDPTEITNLRQRGWREAKPVVKAVETKTSK